MEDKLLIAFIAAGSALLGALIPSLLTYLNNNKQRKFEIRKMLVEKQNDAYRNLLLSLQEFGNQPDKSSENFYNLQSHVLQVVMYGDDVASNAVNDYYQELVKSSTGERAALSPEEHNRHHGNILNGIRKSLELGEISNFYLTRFVTP